MADNTNRPPEDLSLDDLTDEEIEMVKNWAYPNFTEDLPINNRASAFGHPVHWYNKTKKEPEIPDEQEQIKPLTAEEIEAIRQAAYEEGLLQGHAEGLIKGEKEGHQQGLEQGMKQGHEQGLETGIAEGQRLIEEQVLRWQGLYDKLREPLYEVNVEVEKQLVELAVYLAQTVIDVEIKTNKEVIINTIRQSVLALPHGDSECVISVNPQDLSLITDYFGEQEIEDRGWHLKADANITQGGCIIDSQRSSIDSNIKTRVRQIFERFMQESGIDGIDGIDTINIEE